MPPETATVSPPLPNSESQSRGSSALAEQSDDEKRGRSPGSADALRTDVLRNGDVDWDGFDPHAYQAVNYLRVRVDDRQIVRILRAFFGEHGPRLRTGPRRGDGRVEPDAIRAVDVGTGSNLYPALAMLPFVDQLCLVERGAENVAWLQAQQREFDEHWASFWAELRREKAYSDVGDPRGAFSRKTSIQQLDLFDLPKRCYDIGTMFFVAESMSTEQSEFSAAIDSFVGSLRKGAPFAAAFMEDSHGYEVNGRWFPAYAVDSVEVRNALEVYAPECLEVHRVTYGTDVALRADHHAMIVATGRVQ